MTLLAIIDWNPIITAIAAVLMAAPAIFMAWMDLRHKIMLMQANVMKIEVATNSMKDALVQKTEDEALLRGAANEKARVSDLADSEANRRAPSGSPTAVRRMNLATTNVKTGDMLATKEDLLDAVKEVQEDVQEAKSRDVKKKT